MANRNRWMGVIAWLVIAVAAHAQTTPIASDEAVLIVHCPSDARLQVNGYDNGTGQGPSRRLSFPGVNLQKLSRAHLRLQFGNGDLTERVVLLHPGRQVETVFDSPDEVRPVPVVQRGHAAAVNDVTISPDGQFVLTGGEDNLAVLWDAETGRQLRTYRGPTESVTNVGFFPDGNRIGVNFGNAYRIFDRDSGERLFNLISSSTRFSSVKISPDGRQVALAESRFISFFDMAQGAFKSENIKHDSYVWRAVIAWSPDGRLLAVGGEKNDRGHLEIWNATTRKRVHRLTGRLSEVSGVCFSPDGRYLASGHGYYKHASQLLLWNVSSGKLEKTFSDVPPGDGKVRSLTFAPDGTSLLAVCDEVGKLGIWDIDSGRRQKLIAADKSESSSKVNAVAFGGQKGQVIVGESSGATVIREIDSDRLLQVLTGRVRNPEAIAATPDGKTLALGAGKQIVLWDTDQGIPVKKLIGHTGDIRRLDMDEAGRLLLSTDHSSVRVWDLETGQVHRSIGTTGSLGVTFADGGKRLLTADHDRVQVRDSANGRLLRTIRIGDLIISDSLQASPANGRFLVVTGEQPNRQSVSLWDIETGMPLVSLDSPFAGYMRTAMLHDGRVIVGGVLPPDDKQEGEPRPVLQELGIDGSRRTIWTGESETELSGLSCHPSQNQVVIAVSADVANRRKLLLLDISDGSTIASLVAPDGNVNKLVFSSDGGSLFALWRASDKTHVSFWDVNDGARGQLLKHGMEHVYGIAGSDSPNELHVVGMRDKQPDLGAFDVKRNQRRRTYAGHTGYPNGRLIAVSASTQRMTSVTQGEMILWNTSTAKRIASWPRIGGSMDAAAISADGKLVAIANHDASKHYTVTLWDVESESYLRTLSSRNVREYYRHVAFSSDGRKVVAGASQEYVSVPDKPLTKVGDTAVVWDTKTGRELLSTSDETAVRFDGSGGRILTKDGSWLDAASGRRVLNSPGHTEPIESIAVSSDGKWAVTGDWDGRAIIWYVPHRTQRQELRGHKSMVSAVGISPKSSMVATGDENGTVMVWNTSDGIRRYSLSKHSRKVTAVEFSPDGGRLATASLDGKVFVYEASSGRSIGSLPAQVPTIVDLVWHPNGKRVAVGYGADGGGGEWDLASRRQLKRFTGHKEAVWTVAYSRDGSTIFSGGSYGKGFLWNASTGARMQTLESSKLGMAVHSAFSSDDSQLYVLNANGMINVYDRNSGLLKVQYAAGEAQGKGLVVVPNEKLVFSSTLFDRDVTIMREDSEKSWHTLGNLRSIGWSYGTKPRLSRDGKLLLMLASDGRFLVADAVTGKQLQGFEGHTDDVNDAVFFGNDSRILSIADDGTARIWDAATGEELLQLVMLNDGNEWVSISPRGLFDGSAVGREKVSFRVGEGLKLVAVDRFFQDFYRPGLVGELIGGDRPLPKSAFAGQAAPVVRITEPVSGGDIETPTVTLTVDITNGGGGIKGPWITHNGARILAETSIKDTDNGRRVTIKVPLVEGANRLEVQAASTDGSWESEPAGITLNYRQAVEAAQVFVLAVGVSNYAEETMNLKFAAEDARSIAEVFRSRAPGLYGKERVHVRTLIDKEATTKAITGALEEIASNAKPQDTFVLFMAGHGTMVGQRYYFLPQEFQHRQGELEADVREQGLAGDTLNDALNKVPALKRVAIYDTCSSGGALALYRGGRGPFAFRQALQKMSRSTGSYCIAAAAATAEAKEIKSLGHGVLTYSLLAGADAVDVGPLDGQSVRSEDSTLDVRDWFNFAQDKVPLLTKLLLGSEQFVSYEGSGNNFPILPKIQVASEK